jgi:hypothetical protein
VLDDAEIETVIRFVYKKLLHHHQIPAIVVDRDYCAWTYGMGRAPETLEKERK